MSRRSKHAVALLLLGALDANAQSAKPSSTSPAAVARARVWLVPKADTVFVFVVDAPGAGGFTLTRSTSGAAREILTPQPVRRERDPVQLAVRLGGDLPLVQRAVGAADEVELIRRLSSDPFFGTVASALYRNVALAMGRLYIDTAVTVGAEYEYRLTYLRADGNTDPRRKPVVERVRVADTPLPPPVAAKIEGSDDRAMLTWSYPRYAGDSRDRAIAFVVERSDSGGAFRRVSAIPVIRNDAVPRMSFADSGLQTGVRYRYRMRAIDIAGRAGPPSTEVTIATLDKIAPAVPEALSLEAGDSRVLVQWKRGAEPDLAGYWVERSLSLDKPFTRLNRSLIPLGDAAFVDSAVTGPWQHFYRVVAVDSAGNASRPTTALGASPTDKRPPVAPASVATAVAARRVTLRWPASASRDLLGYYVYRGATSDAMVRLTAQPISETQFVDSGFERKGLAPGGSYAVAVSAVDQSYNESERRETRVEIPDDERPRAPASVRALNVSGRAVDVTWSPSPSNDATTYVVTRVGLNGELRELGSFAATEALALRDTAALTHGRWYRYRVIAKDKAGNRSEPAIDSALFADAVPPSPTRHVSAVIMPGGGVSLRWDPVIDDELAGFHVYRATIPTGIGTRLTTSPVAGPSFIDRTGRAEHWYVITAVDRSGNASARSDAVQPVVRAASASAATRAGTTRARSRSDTTSSRPSTPRRRAPRDTGGTN